MESLFGFIEYDKFKAQILKIKTGAIDYNQDEIKASKGNLVLNEDSDFGLLEKEDINDPTLKWKKSMEMKPGKMKGVHGTIHSRPMKNSKLNLVRS